MRKYIYLLFIVLLFDSGFVKSRPVSYPGGLTLMLMNNSMKNSLHTHYSPTAQKTFQRVLVSESVRRVWSLQS